MVVSSGQWGDSAIYIHGSILPQSHSSSDEVDAAFGINGTLASLAAPSIPVAHVTTLQGLGLLNWVQKLWCNLWYWLSITLPTKVHIENCGLPSGHMQLWKLDYKEGRAPKNWCLPTVVLEKIPEDLLESKEIKPVNLKGYQPWILIGRTDAEAKAPVFWSSDVNSQLIGKVVPDAGKDWGQKEKKVSKDEMAGWHHRCNGLELGQTLGDSEGQASLACCSPWGHKELDMTEWLNNNKLLEGSLPSPTQDYLIICNLRN